MSANLNSYQIGAEVVCMDNTNVPELVRGQTYLIIKTVDFPTFKLLRLRGMKYFYKHSHFTVAEKELTKGDKVECLNNTLCPELNIGQIYTVTEVDDLQLLKLDGLEYSYGRSRFKKV